MIVFGEEAAQQAHERDLARRRFFKGTTRIAVGFSSEGAHNAPAKRVMLTVGRHWGQQADSLVRHCGQQACRRGSLPAQRVAHGSFCLSAQRPCLPGVLPYYRFVAADAATGG